MARRIVVLDAPSNLGLRPPAKGSPPGCYKAPWALRNAGLIAALRAEDAGCVVPPRYDATWKRGDGDRNAEAIASYSLRLADRVGEIVDRGDLPVVLGGDCSVLIGHMLALRRRGRYGLIFLDAHSDFRHPENAEAIGAAAGEDLAIVTGRGDRRLIKLDELRPYAREDDIHVLGIRPNDIYRGELEKLGIAVATSTEINEGGPATMARSALETVTRAASGFWVHLDVDVVDSSEMPAADCPEPHGISFATLTILLREVLGSSKCAGIEVTIYDPDLDLEGEVAPRIVACLSNALL